MWVSKITEIWKEVSDSEWNKFLTKISTLSLYLDICVHIRCSDIICEINKNHIFNKLIFDEIY